MRTGKPRKILTGMRPLWDVSTRANAHREYTRKSVLTMELEDSLIRISDADKLREAGLDPLRVGALVADTFAEMALCHGHVHGASSPRPRHPSQSASYLLSLSPSRPRAPAHKHAYASHQVIRTLATSTCER